MTLYTLLAALAIHSLPLPQQHQWAPLVITGSEKIDIDTGSITTIDSRVRRVWLRWNMDAAATFGPRYQPQYELELRDFDCSTNRTKTVQKRHEISGQASGAGESLSSTETSWQKPLAGSLLAQVFEATCRLTKAGA
jgi:hypothetical protein